jgi:hypothetical protein
MTSIRAPPDMHRMAMQRDNRMINHPYFFRKIRS